jgi:hypothetical protein
MGWIGIDLDRTVAYYDKWRGYEHIGRPIETMQEFVRKLIAEGKEVRIFTARAYPIMQPVHEKFSEKGIQSQYHEPELQGAMRACNAIIDWCELHLGKRLPITCVKDYGMDRLYDDRAVQVIVNTGKIVCHS